MNTDTKTLPDSSRAVSPLTMRKIPASEILPTDRGDEAFELLVDWPDFKLLRNSKGDFAIDTAIGIDVAQEADGEYCQRRLRRTVCRESALAAVLAHVVPDCFNDLINGTLADLLQADSSARRAVDARLNGEPAEAVSLEEFTAMMPRSLDGRKAYLESGFRLFPDTTPQGRSVREMLYHLNRHEICRRELLSGE